MKRQQKMQRMQREAEQRKTLQDPMKRLELLQRKRGDDVSIPTRVSVTQLPPSGHNLLIHRQEARPDSLQWLEPTAADRALPGVERGVDMWQAAEVQEELELSSVGDGAAYHTFSSDPPNAKLARARGGGALRTGRSVARINNFVMSPPPSAGAAAVVLPAGSALQAARAASTLRQ